LRGDSRCGARHVLKAEEAKCRIENPKLEILNHDRLERLQREKDELEKAMREQKERDELEAKCIRGKNPTHSMYNK